jgi:hypothetical protein
MARLRRAAKNRFLIKAEPLQPIETLSGIEKTLKAARSAAFKVFSWF